MVQLELLLLLAFHFACTALPGAAAALFAARRGVRSIPVLIALAMAATGVVAMGAFWAFYGDRTLGETFAYFVLFGSILVVGVSLWGNRIDRDLLRHLATPFALWGLGSAFLIFLGFIHGGTDSPISTAAVRFSAGSLPSDNDLPHFFTEWFFVNGHHGTPPVYPAGWLFSDRPPLQVGYDLFQRGFVWKASGLDYQVLGVVLQQMWILGLWALLVAARVGRTTRALAVGAVLLSDLAIVNGFFVWPKMLPAAMLIAAAALVVTPLWKEIRGSLWGAALVAALLGLAMLGHGSSIFGVIPIALIAAWRGLPSWRWLGVLAGVGLLLMVPWSAYQKYGDPPGNRLTKWMLAGVDEIDPRGTREAIFDSYSEAGIGGTVHNKAENFVTMAGGASMVALAENAVDATGEGDLTLALKEVRSILFLFELPSLGLLLVALVLMAVFWRRGRRESPVEWSFAMTCLGIAALGSVVWGLILFGNTPARTVLHAGSFAIPILLFCACVAGLRSIFPRFAIWWIAIATTLMFGVYVPMFEGPAGSSYSALGAILAAASLLGFGLIAFRAGSAYADAEPLAADESGTRPSAGVGAASPPATAP